MAETGSRSSSSLLVECRPPHGAILHVELSSRMSLFRLSTAKGITTADVRRWTLDSGLEQLAPAIKAEKEAAGKAASSEEHPELAVDGEVKRDIPFTTYLCGLETQRWISKRCRNCVGGR